MWIFETAAVAFSMFSVLPMPQFEWNEKNMRYALAAFPLVGTVIGLAWWGWSALCSALAIPALLRGAVLCVMPLLITGGIHLDGYADVSDALASHASPERRQEILRDPHCGAFAMMRMCAYFTVYFALCCVWEPSPRGLWCAGLSFVLSRALSGLALTVLPIAEGSSLAKAFTSAADRKRVSMILAAVIGGCLVGMYLCGGAITLAAAASAALTAVLWYAHTAKRQFGGTSGDLAGWFLVKAELWMLAALVAVQFGENLT